MGKVSQCKRVGSGLEEVGLMSFNDCHSDVPLLAVARRRLPGNPVPTLLTIYTKSIEKLKLPEVDVASLQWD